MGLGNFSNALDSVKQSKAAEGGVSTISFRRL
jgi:hypothetical protein